VKIKLKTVEEMNLSEPFPWYVNPVFQGIEFEVDETPMQKQNRLFWKFKKSFHNYDILHKKWDYLSNRMKLKIARKELHTVFIEFECSDISESSNKDFRFLLKEEEELA
jgi:hypothetical protein